MSNIQLGSFVLNTELLVYLASALAGALALRLLRRGHPGKEADLSAAWGSMLLWIVIWKGSLLLIDPASVVQRPLSLLYFSGGTAGFWLATIVSAGWALYRYSRRYTMAESLTLTGMTASGWAAMYALASLFFSRDVQLYHWIVLLVALASSALLLRLNRTEKPQAEDGRRTERRQPKRIAVQGLSLLGLLILLAYTLHGATESLLEGTSTSGSDEVGAKVGDIAPPFGLTNLEGEMIALGELRGKTVMVNFWTTWCKVCRTEMPHVEKLYEHYKEQGEEVAIVTVNVTSQESSAKKVGEVASAEGYSFPVALDSSGKTTDDYRVAAYPTTFVIDESGVVRERYLGAISFTDMKKRIDHIRSLD
ncbi:TlpA family protein disulfide reductase [Paenibacillus sp. J5C_2022]|uniref:TlpA family protein disulfide reductase n=1 Tax=Paenibacillus sp. J5C2022 TaxID=2977129 RepID=UPI0021CF6C92|nr:TlpA disulfide reductase family protein [Paenibacillus sp. J5C2022]MCU6712607.1 TlpA family protein disulfide reductase [Paenibacillus sp. J5C2022]